MIQLKGLDILDKVEKKDWLTLYSDLSKYVHTILHTPTGKKIKYGDIEIPDCYAIVEYNKKDLIEWSNFYQRVMFLILHRFWLVIHLSKDQMQAR